MNFKISGRKVWARIFWNSLPMQQSYSSFSWVSTSKEWMKYQDTYLKIQQASIYYAGLLGRSSHQPTVWWSKYSFDRLKIDQWVAGLVLGHSKLFIFVKLWKNNLKGFLQRILQEIMKKIILGTSDAWLMRRSSHRPTDPAYYIEDCRIFIWLYL